MGELNLLFWLLAGAGVAAAVLHGVVFLHRPPSLVRAATKTAFMALITAAVLNVGAHPLLIVALAASAAGDFFLAWDKKALLPLGILSFLIAQLCYFAIFMALWLFAGDISPIWPRYVLMALVIASALAFLIWMAPKLGWMALGVVPYAMAITAMGVMAMWLPWAGWPAMVGALNFLVSDFILAAELFRLAPDSPWRKLTPSLVWWSYVDAQVLILAGIVIVAGQGG